MTLRSPIQLEPGSCGCSVDGTHCACMPADFERMSSELRDARYRIDATDDPDEKAKRRAEHARLGKEMTAAMQHRTDVPAQEQRTDSDDLEQRAFDLIERYRGVPAVEAMKSELIGKSDAYRRTRLDAVLAEEDRYKREALSAEVIAAGNHDEHTQCRRYRAVRNDAAIRAPHEPAVRWPPGFDRAKAIAALQAAGVPTVYYDGDAFVPIAKASDAWILGAFTRLQDSSFINAQTSATLAKGHYRPAAARRHDVAPTSRGETGWRYPFDTKAPSRTPMFPGLEDDDA